MKKTICLFLVAAMALGARSQDLAAKDVPGIVKRSLVRQFPAAIKVSWEKEKGNYEANWGGRSGEDNSAQFTPAGAFVEIVKAIPVSSLPANVSSYVNTHYPGAKIKEAGSVTDAAGKKTFEAEIKGRDLIFDLDGNFIREDK
jgi:hypothetical protein